MCQDLGNIIATVVVIIEHSRQPGICAQNNTHVSRFDLSNLRLFLCIRSTNDYHDLNTDRKRQLFNFRKGTEVLKGGI